MEDWTLVNNKKKKAPEPEDKIAEPCWFFNNGGCRRKDGSKKTSDECKYQHVYCDKARRPPHLNARKPCDKYNFEGECKWYDNCKYSHRNLTPDEWFRYYPGIPYTLKLNLQKRLLIEARIADIEGRIRVLEFKQEGITRDLQSIKQCQEGITRDLQSIKQCVLQLKNSHL